MPALMTGACPHRLAHVQAALRRRAADLRDSLVLSEFLQDLQEEEARSQQGPAAVSSVARCPLRSPSTWDRPKGCSVAGKVTLWVPLSSPAAWGVIPHLPHAQCFCWLQPGSECCGLQGSFPLLSAQASQPLSSKDMSRPLGDLQEAVEMLNDAAKERERVMEVAVETESLERLVGGGGGGSGDAATWSTCSWTCWLVGTDHMLRLVAVGHRALVYMGTTLCKAGIPISAMAGPPCPFAGVWQGASRLGWAGAACQVVAQVPRWGSSVFPRHPPHLGGGGIPMPGDPSMQSRGAGSRHCPSRERLHHSEE